jgi:hypothetical protein
VFPAPVANGGGCPVLEEPEYSLRVDAAGAPPEWLSVSALRFCSHPTISKAPMTNIEIRFIAQSRAHAIRAQSVGLLFLA